MLNSPSSRLSTIRPAMTKPFSTTVPPSARPQPAAPDWVSVGPGEHIVQYYEQESALLDSLRVYLVGGLQRGESAVVILTEPHRFGLEVRLAGDGIDVAAVRRAGRYVSLDADATLAEFMVDGLPDPERFARVIGLVLAPASRPDGVPRHVRAFGEMVAILWERGNREAAIRLEQMWNDLASVHSFSLLCAY